jgi:GTPase SAR1 family protein
MIAHSFEIKIALLGNVSAGKTTVLNALFRDKFGSLHEANHCGVNYFASPQLRLGCRD